MASPGRPRKTDIDGWRKKAEAFGIPLDDLIAALRDEVVSAVVPLLSETIRQPVDLEALSLKVAEQLKATLPIVGPGEIERVQAALSGDLGENIQVVQAKLEELVVGVQAKLKTQVDAIEASIPQRLNQAVSESAPGIVEAVVQRLEAKFGGQDGGRSTASGGNNTGTKSLLSDLLAAAAGNMDTVKEIVALLRGQQSPDEKIVSEALRAFRLTDVITRMREGERDAGKLLQVIKSGSTAT